MAPEDRATVFKWMTATICIYYSTQKIEQQQDLYKYLFFSLWQFSFLFSTSFSSIRHLENVSFSSKRFIFLLWENVDYDFAAGVNFINILRIHFSYESLLSSFSLPRVRLWTNFYPKKCTSKMMMKLSPAVDFINILHAHFLYKFFAKAKA